MKVIYPYNEILPKKRAHDVFIFHECAALAALGCDTSLLVGKNGLSDEALFAHYQVTPTEALHIQRLFILRKNNPLHLSWNLPFFIGCQRWIRKARPNWVVVSVRKQAAYHLLRKIPKVRYLYEVHELSAYPHDPEIHRSELQFEKMILSRADLVTVTTAALKEILLKPPYSIKTPIEVVPLGVAVTPLTPPPPAEIVQLMYVGQLYAEQGLTYLLSAMAKVQKVHLKVLGGTPTEIAHFTRLAKELDILSCVDFLGFVPPSQIPPIVKEAHAFVAPFDERGRMPYVAHTKLFEYAEWGRPIIAPNLPIVQEHFKEGNGVLLFEPGNSAALAGCIQTLQEDRFLKKLQTEITAYSGKFSWKARAEAYLNLMRSFA